MNSSKVWELAVIKLNQFGFDLDKDVVASTTNAASVSVKFGKYTSQYIYDASVNAFRGICIIY